MQLPLYLRKTLTGALFLGILFLTFWIRIQGVERLPGGRFTENDAYLYHWQAGIIVERGVLPARDMHRWLPLGRGNGQLLSLYAYALAYTHKAFPWLALYDIQLYAPVICFTLALGALLLFLIRCCGIFFAAIVGVLLATLPGSVERSAVGFGDRDAWCWMFGVFAVMSYFWKENMVAGRRRWIVTALAGFIVFLGGLSWEAFGIFVLIILAAEVWKFCTTETEQHLKEYLLWCLMFVPWLYLVSPAYRSGYGFSTHLSVLMLVPPIAVITLRGVRHLLLHFYEPLRPHARKLAGGLTLFAIAAGGSYLFYQAGTFETTAFALQESLLGSLGLIIATLHLWKWHGLPLLLALALFVSTTFFWWPVSAWIGEGRCDTLFFIALGLTALGLGIACRRKAPDPLVAQGFSASAIHIERVTLVMLAWFLLWVALSRGGKRYDFFIGIPLAYGTAWLLWQLPVFFLQNLSQHINTYRWFPACFTIVVLVPVLFWNPLGGHATRATAAAAKWRKPVSGHQTPLAQTLQWMKTTRPKDAVVAANWSYGSRLNVLGGVKTITDQDTFLPHWIHLYYRHVYCAQSAREALSFLKTHGATHLMLTEWGIISKAERYSYIGSDVDSDRRFEFTRLISLSDKRLSRMGDTPFLSIEAPDITTLPHFLKAHLKNGEVTKLPYVAFQGTQHHTSKTSSDENLYGGVLLYYDAEKTLEKASYIPTIGWQSLAVRLYFLGHFRDIFVPIYPVNGHDIARVKVWEIHYPPDIETDDTYLATEPERRDGD